MKTAELKNDMHKMKEQYWSRFPDSYDDKMTYVVGEELLIEIKEELKKLPELGELAEFG